MKGIRVRSSGVEDQKGDLFFKQKTAYEGGTGDWSSDVCSSDLQRDRPAKAIAVTRKTCAMDMSVKTTKM